ncbi:MAG: phosphatase PAP2 family protein [Alphaproteobacteria bacterium]|nr:phosphatase PAP2 family protein [Alphaproteobacteria bacterium]
MSVFYSLFAFLLALPFLWPRLDLLASGFFYRAGQGFFLADNPVLVALHELAYVGPRLLAVAFLLCAVAALLRRKNIVTLDAKAWLFLLLALIIGPGLVANVALKDHWGRARPHEIVEFGGTQTFTPALEPHFERAKSNGSFPCGDGSFGFFLPAFGFVVSPRRARRAFWVGMGSGFVLSLVRVMQGGHFFSDCVYAAFFMLLTTTALYAAMYGRREAAQRWRAFFRRSAAD